jgi:hypothetical protein
MTFSSASSKLSETLKQGLYRPAFFRDSPHAVLQKQSQSIVPRVVFVVAEGFSR